MAVELLCLKLEIQYVVSVDSQIPAGLFLDCTRKGADHSRLYQSCQEPKVEVEEEVGLPSFPVPRLRIFQYSFMHF